MNKQQQCPQCFHLNAKQDSQCKLCGKALNGSVNTTKPQSIAALASNPLDKALEPTFYSPTIVLDDSEGDVTIAPSALPPTDLPVTTAEQLLANRSPGDIAIFNLAGDLAHFEVHEVLGKGGMGTVYRAKDKTLERDVAVKMLRSASNAAHLLDEAKMVCKLNHPNIVTVFDVARAQDSNFIVMEWCDGQSLDWVIPEQGLPLETALDYACQIIEGISCAHQNQIIHSDIKPQNIMLTTDGTIKILDFGIAGLVSHQKTNTDKQQTAEYESGRFIGSPGYVSPEQALGSRTLDQRSDIFSFGIVLYQMLSGQRPFDGNNNVERNNAVLSGHYPELSAQLPVDLRAIVSHCMAHAPDNRYQSAAQLADDLKRFKRGEPVSIMQGYSYWLKKKLRKNKWPVMLMLLLSLGGFSSLVWQQYQNHEQQIREQLITTFVGRVESLEAKVQLSKMATRHDTTLEAAQWQREITALSEEISSIGDTAFGPGHYAIGRMYYALQQYDEALSNLQLAWNSGFQQTRVAYNLALSHGAIYQRQKAIINNISSASARKDKMVLLDKQHREPAIKYLEQGMSGSPYLSYAKALLQYYQGNGEQALETLKQATDLPVWFYQHHLLSGDIYLAKAETARAIHDDKLMESHAQKALYQYTQALELGRSDLQVQLRPMAIYFQRLANALYGKQKDFNDTYLQAMMLLDYASRIAPQSYLPYMIKGQLLSKKADYEDQHSGKPIATQQQSIDQLALALTRSSNNVDVLLSLGLAYFQKIKLLQDRALPVEQAFVTATDAFDHIPEQNRDYFFFNNYASLLQMIAIHKAQQHQVGLLKKEKDNHHNRAVEMNNSFNQAFSAYQQASRIAPKRIGAKVNAASVYRRWSEFIDPTEAQQKLKKAIEHYKSALKLNPKHFVVNYYLGISYRWLARINNTLFIPNKDEMLKAGVYLKQAQHVKSGHPFVVVEMAKLTIDQAIYYWQHGLLYEDSLVHAKNSLEQALVTHDNNNMLLDNRAWAYLISQQLDYFNLGLRSNSVVSYNEALTKIQSILSSKTADYYLLQLLYHQWEGIKKVEIEALPANVSSQLAKALWYSQSGRFEQAEQYFNVIKQYYPSLLWLYRRQHLQRWVKAKQTSLSEQKKSWLSQQISLLDKQLQNHYPALVVVE